MTSHAECCLFLCVHALLSSDLLVVFLYTLAILIVGATPCSGAACAEDPSKRTPSVHKSFTVGGRVSLVTVVRMLQPHMFSVAMLPEFLY